MDKYDVAQILDACGTLLALQGENQFRCLAYHNGARAVEQLEQDIVQLVTDGKLSEVRGIGETLAKKIELLVTSGRLEFYEELQAKTPAGLVEMLRIPGMGPKKIKAIFDQLGIDNLNALKEGCLDGRVARLKGFGERTAKKILTGIAYVAQAGQRFRLDEAMAIASRLLHWLQAQPGVIRCELCGSLRRRRETIKDIDLLVSASESGAIMDGFVSLSGVVDVITRGPTKSSVLVNPGIQADIRVVQDEQFPFALHYFTGSKQHNIRMRARAIEYGLKLNEYELASDTRKVRCEDEAAIFATLDMDYVPPELREDTGEIEAAVEHRLPKLIRLDDLQGTFHCHTTWSDGSATLAEMAEAAQQRNLKYLGIADHSQTAAYAGGLTIDRVREQQAEIDALNARMPHFRLFKGIESDILPDGKLDYPDEVLASFDYVVASLHSAMSMSREEMTQRVIRAVSNPYCTMLGHATGRLLLRRDGVPLDLDAVIDACARFGTMIEINANPRRLDLDWQYCKRAKAKGVRLVINPDAHSTIGLDDLPFGVDVARRGWLETNDVLNTRSVSDVLPLLRKSASRVAP
jgi:DNA polymerase (family 10)